MVVNSVDKAFRIVSRLANRGNLSLSEICASEGLAKSTAFNILSTLCLHRVVVKDERLGVYRLGPGLLPYARAAERDFELVAIAKPTIDALRDRTGETCYLTILDDDQVLYVYCAESRLVLRAYSALGVHAPLHCTSVGKAILAFLPAPRVDAVIKTRGLERFTKQTITTAVALRRDLAAVRERGYALDNGEHEDILNCVGAPIRNAEGEVFGAISVAGPAQRLPLARRQELAPKVMSAANEISSALGWREQRH